MDAEIKLDFLANKRMDIAINTFSIVGRLFKHITGED